MDRATMNRQQQIELLEELRTQLADIERQQEDRTLPHSDQQLLDQAWDDVTNQIEELEEVLELAEQFDEAHWRDAAQFLDSEDSDDEPPRRVTYAPPPPTSRTMESALNRHGQVVARLPGGEWHVVPPPTVALETWVRPDGAVMTGLPPPISIPPRVSFLTMAPPPPAPRPATPVPPNVEALANAPPLPETDEEETESDSEAVELEDDRDGCRYCSGCMYCQSSDGYDPAGEI
jgi:hypothetical protein